MVLQDVPRFRQRPVLQGKRKEWLDQSPGTTCEGQGHTTQDRKGGKERPGRALPGLPWAGPQWMSAACPGSASGPEQRAQPSPKAPTQGSRWTKCENWFLSVHFPADRAQDTGYGAAWSTGISPQQLHSPEHCLPVRNQLQGLAASAETPGRVSAATPSSPGWGFAWHCPPREDLQRCPCVLFLRAPLCGPRPQQRALN